MYSTQCITNKIQENVRFLGPTIAKNLRFYLYRYISALLDDRMEWSLTDWLKILVESATPFEKRFVTDPKLSLAVKLHMNLGFLSFWGFNAHICCQLLVKLMILESFTQSTLLDPTFCGKMGHSICLPLLFNGLSTRRILLLKTYQAHETPPVTGHAYGNGVSGN